MIELLVALLLVCVLIYVANLVIGMLNLPPQVKTIVYIILGLVVLFWLLQFLGIYDSGMNLNVPK